MSTIMAAGFVIAVAIIIIAVLRSLLTGGRTMRRGSGNPGIPYGGSSGTSGGGGWDGGGSSGGDGGGGGCGGGGGGGE